MAPQQAAGHAEIRRQIERLVDAIQRRSIDLMESIYAPDIVSFDVNPPMRRVGLAAKLANWSDAFQAFQSALEYEVRDLAIDVDGEIGFAHSVNRLSTVSEDAVRRGPWVRATVCFRRIDGEWRITNDHVSVPVDIETGQGVLELGA